MKSRDDNEHAGLAGRRAARPAFGVLFAVLLTGLAVAPQVRAGTYMMRNCDVPGHANAGLGPWQITVVPSNMAAVDECVKGGGLGFAFSGPRRLAADTGVLLTLSGANVGPRSPVKLVKVAV